MAQRPGSVTFVAVLTYINGILNIIGGVIILLTRNSMVSGRDSAALTGITTAAIISLILGVVIVIVARGLLRGSTGSRAIVTVVMIIDILNGVLLLFASQVVNGVIQILWALLIVLLLYTRRANDFFAGR
ncbi:DUF7144 family membrane protein [Leifsonia sp. 2MCAF36]|uniref:DUF7144 family membrane protein n=1 Tax=Leifsonia sp. 2MCAF36 TaxID=3232988 RepID=UPI003F9C047F